MNRNRNRAHAIGALLALAAATSAHGQATTNTDLVPSTPTPSALKRAIDPAAPPRAGWWNDAVFYQVFVRSFQDSRSGPLAADGIGDFQGLTDRLDFINDNDPATTTDLGATAIWLMPVMQSPSYHGYDITDYRTIERDYGTNQDFKNFLAAAHSRGIKVILDLVLNHTSNLNPWFIESADPKSPKHDWFLWADHPPTYKGPWGQTVWHPARDGIKGSTAAESFYGLFSSAMPDVNFRSKAASDEMLSVVKFWLDAGDGGGVDGYRLDAIRHLIEDGQQQDNTPATHEWLRTFFKFYKGVNPNAMCVGEVWAPTPIASSYVGGEMDLVFEFDMAEAIIAAARDGKAAPLAKALRTVLESYPTNQFATFLTNHDQTRVMTRLRNNPGAMRTAAATLLLGPGVPFIYYAEELGMQGDKPDPDLRLPMPWTGELPGVGFTTGKPWKPARTDAPTINVASESADENSLLSHYRRLIRTRMANPALRTGRTRILTTPDPGVFALLRWIETPENGERPQTAIVALNFGTTSVNARPLTDPLPGDWALDQIVTFGGATPPPPEIGNTISLPQLPPQSATLIVLKSR